MRTGDSSRLWPSRRWTTRRSRSCCKKILKPRARRVEASYAMEGLGLSERRACLLTGVSPSVYRYEEKRGNDSELPTRMREPAGERKRLGSPRLCIMLKREGLVVNHRRTESIWRRTSPSTTRRRSCSCFSGTGSVSSGRNPATTWADMDVDRLYASSPAGFDRHPSATRRVGRGPRPRFRSRPSTGSEPPARRLMRGQRASLTVYRSAYRERQKEQHDENLL